MDRSNKSQHITELVNAERKRRGYTTKEFAEMLGVTVRSVDYWNKGKRVMTDLDIIDRALSILGIRIVLGDEEHDTYTKDDIRRAVEKIKEKQ